jgi:hypothetical protein
VRKVEGIASWFEMQCTYGTIEACVPHCLLSSQKAASYIQSLTNGQPKSSIHMRWSPSIHIDSPLKYVYVVTQIIN